MKLNNPFISAGVAVGVLALSAWALAENDVQKAKGDGSSNASNRLSSPSSADSSSALLLADTGTLKEKSKGSKGDANAASAKETGAAAKSEKKLSGQELYAINCNRCHAERYPTEFTANQWKTLLIHMRVRAGLPAEEARTVLKYMQENSGK